ncbi:MAG TPA: hypothetical protein VFZ09_40545 [Archangium sp.]|uniref:hypothetical protein n=1 Tax=Archangium sp. TaxID=1872627 RepID=UPI002E37E679|nr:hypothetical protein [Archangium sp.]HEX5752565.1 hypothetical protein [Archangium sp.]
MVLQFLLHLEGAVDELDDADEQVPSSHLQHQGAVLQRQVAAQEVEGAFVRQFQPFILEVLVLVEDFFGKHPPPFQKVSIRKNSPAIRRPCRARFDAVVEGKRSGCVRRR